MEFSITFPDGIDKITVESYDPYFIEPSYEDIFCRDDVYNLKIQLKEFEKMKPRIEKVIKKAKKAQLHEISKRNARDKVIQRISHNRGAICDLREELAELRRNKEYINCENLENLSNTINNYLLNLIPNHRYFTYVEAYVLKSKYNINNEISIDDCKMYSNLIATSSNYRNDFIKNMADNYNVNIRKHSHKIIKQEDYDILEKINICRVSFPYNIFNIVTSISEQYKIERLEIMRRLNENNRIVHANLLIDSSTYYRNSYGLNGFFNDATTTRDLHMQLIKSFFNELTHLHKVIMSSNNIQIIKEKETELYKYIKVISNGFQCNMGFSNNTTSFIEVIKEKFPDKNIEGGVTLDDEYYFKLNFDSKHKNLIELVIPSYIFKSTRSSSNDFKDHFSPLLYLSNTPKRSGESPLNKDTALFLNDLIRKDKASNIDSYYDIQTVFNNSLKEFQNRMKTPVEERLHEFFDFEFKRLELMEKLFDRTWKRYKSYANTIQENYNTAIDLRHDIKDYSDEINEIKYHYMTEYDDYSISNI